MVADINNTVYQEVGQTPGFHRTQELADPKIIEQIEGDHELQELKRRERFGENTKSRSSAQIKEDEEKVKMAIHESINKLSLDDDNKRVLHISVSAI